MEFVAMPASLSEEAVIEETTWQLEEEQEKSFPLGSVI